jgi:hypothetical protein
MKEKVGLMQDLYTLRMTDSAASTAAYPNCESIGLRRLMPRPLLQLIEDAGSNRNFGHEVSQHLDCWWLADALHMRFLRAAIVVKQGSGALSGWEDFSI